jgi:hypothetical protein
MKRVTRLELMQILSETKTIKGMPMFASVLQYTSAKLVKKSRTDKDIKNPYPDAKKLSKVSIILNSGYEKAVTNQLTREEKEKDEYKKGKNTMPLVYGENNIFYGTFNGNPVLEYRPNDNVRPRTKYLNNNKLIDKAKIQEFLPAINHAENQGTEREILWRKLYVKNVVKIAINGETYKVID